MANEGETDQPKVVEQKEKERNKENGLTFMQEGYDITVEVPIGDTPTKQMKVDIKEQYLKIMVGPKLVFEDELLGKVDHYESVWSVCQLRGERHLQVTLIKKKKTNWRCLGKREGEESRLSGEKLNLMTVGDLNPDQTEEEATKNIEDEKVLESEYLRLKAEKGMQDEETLKIFFQYFDNTIQLYRLNKLEAYLDELMPEIRKRTDQYLMKGIQAYGFVLWKQSKFEPALKLFIEMEDALGKNAALCENIAHTYNSLGKYEQAEQYFRDSIKLSDGGPGSNRAGTLLGLGLVRDRLGKHKEALEVVMQSYEMYKQAAEGKPASLQAKAGTSVGKILRKLKRSEEAEFYLKEAVEVFLITCGQTSPLLATAHQEYGALLWELGRRDEAQKHLLKAYELETIKDAFDMIKVLEIHNLIMDTHLKLTDSIERKYFKIYIPIVKSTAARVEKEQVQDGNAAVYYKAAGELLLWACDYDDSLKWITLACKLLREEKSVDTSNLVKQCEDIMMEIVRTQAGEKQMTMTLDVSEHNSKEKAKMEEEQEKITELMEGVE